MSAGGGPSGGPFNGGTPGTYVSPGQYTLDWITSLGGTASLDSHGTGLVLTMPIGSDGVTRVPFPQELQCLIIDYQQSLLAAIQGKVWPPGSDQPPPACSMFWPWF